MTITHSLDALLEEYAVAQTYSLDLITGLSQDEVSWRPDENSSSMAWHLGHQGAVNHYLVRNLTAAEVSFDRGFDAVFDSATTEPDRGHMPPIAEIVDYRSKIAQSTVSIATRISKGDVGAPEQLAAIGVGMLQAIINHEYQHAKWIGEVRSTMTTDPLPVPTSERLTQIEGYYMISAT